MTAPDSKLVERVAWKIALVDGKNEPDNRLAAFKLAVGHDRYLALAHAALDACHAEETQRVLYSLLAAIKTQPVVIFTEQMVTALEDARVLTAKLEQRP